VAVGLSAAQLGGWRSFFRQLAREISGSYPTEAPCARQEFPDEPTIDPSINSRGRCCWAFPHCRDCRCCRGSADDPAGVPLSKKPTESRLRRLSASHLRREVEQRRSYKLDEDEASVPAPARVVDVGASGTEGDLQRELGKGRQPAIEAGRALRSYRGARSGHPVRRRDGCFREKPPSPRTRNLSGMAGSTHDSALGIPVRLKTAFERSVASGNKNGGALSRLRLSVVRSKRVSLTRRASAHRH
jgi:hypothetical protein